MCRSTISGPPRVGPRRPSGVGGKPANGLRRDGHGPRRKAQSPTRSENLGALSERTQGRSGDHGPRSTSVPLPVRRHLATGGEGELVQSTSTDAAMPRSLRRRRGGRPAEDLFHEFPCPLRTSSGACRVVRASIALHVELHRLSPVLDAHLQRSVHIVALVRPDRAASGRRWPASTHRRVAFGCPLATAHTVGVEDPR